ncbi:MAG TPA: hypothetical protein VEU47_01250 [Candidatus Cybelea sp.]|nr:hypothetical protein [Candidatus Cybelea sp.]
MAISITISAGPAEAEQRIIFRHGNFGPDRPFVQSLLEKMRADCPEDDFTMASIAIARFDLDGDGVKELFVMYDHSCWCGSIGCETNIYKKGRSGQWEEYGGTDTAFFEDQTKHPYYYLIAADEVIRGHRTILSNEDGLRWTWVSKKRAYGYVPFCISEQCKHETGEK